MAYHNFEWGRGVQIIKRVNQTYGDSIAIGSIIFVICHKEEHADVSTGLEVKETTEKKYSHSVNTVY